MSYSRSSRTIERVLPLLDDMLLADGERAWPAKHPSKLAYQLREAMFTATQFPEFRKYASLRERYIIRAHAGEVVAEPRVKTATESIKYAVSKLSLDDVLTVEQAIGAAAKHHVEELHLPNFPDQDEEELARLFRWTDSNSVHIISHYGAGITLTHRHPGDLKWMPS